MYIVYRKKSFRLHTCTVLLNDISTFVVCTEAADREISNSKKPKPTEPDIHIQLKSIQRTGKRDGSTDNHVTFDVTEDDDEPDSLEVAPVTNRTTKRRGRGKQPTQLAQRQKVATPVVRH